MDVDFFKVEFICFVIVVYDGMVCVFVLFYILMDGDFVFGVFINVKFIEDFLVDLILLGYVVVICLVCVIVCGVIVVILFEGDLFFSYSVIYLKG